MKDCKNLEKTEKRLERSENLQSIVKISKQQQADFQTSL